MADPYFVDDLPSQYFDKDPEETAEWKASLDAVIDNLQAAYINAEDNASREEPFDGFRTDVEADADALASAGYGTDEDYGSEAQHDYYSPWEDDQY